MQLRAFCWLENDSQFSAVTRCTWLVLRLCFWHQSLIHWETISLWNPLNSVALINNDYPSKCENIATARQNWKGESPETKIRRQTFIIQIRAKWIEQSLKVHNEHSTSTVVVIKLGIKQYFAVIQSKRLITERPGQHPHQNHRILVETSSWPL